MVDREPERLARGYYESIDAGEYDRLAHLLEPTFRHVRNDRTIEGRAAFVRFMRDERPATDTTHEIQSVYRAADDDVAVQGQLLRADGSVWFGFVDVFEVGDGRLAGLTTYSNGRVG
ncbi:MAG TPA: nuclear transport factor 2 family protein [Halobacteriales archaeon]|nr:nuclear transport factor 2 family protein [Halobacteriales archaeon]